MSITLTTAEINQLIIGGQTIETDNAAAVGVLHLDFVNQLLTLQVQKGMVNGELFSPGQIVAGNFTITINMVTGVWSSSTGMGGTFTGTSLSTLKTTLRGYINSAEAFLLSGGLLLGTQVPW